MITHHIQLELLRRLSRQDRLSFGELKPDTLTNNLFVYHLKNLVKAGYVKHEATWYYLTKRGMLYISSLTRTKSVPIKHPAVYVLCVVENSFGEFALLPRPAHPAIGKLTLPGGAVWYDDTLSRKVQEQLDEKLGLQPATRHCGLASIRLRQDDELVTHTYAHIYAAAVDGRPELVSSNEKFTPRWVGLQDVPDDSLMPDVRALIEASRAADGFWFKELEFDL